MCSGVLNGVCCEIDGIIKRYRKKYPSINVIITGGDVKLFDKELKNSIFAAPDLLMEGLNRILQYNEPNIRIFVFVFFLFFVDSSKRN